MIRALLFLAVLAVAACDVSGPICIPALSSPRDCATTEPAE